MARSAHPLGILTRHFFAGLCRPRVLDEAGQDGLKRVFLGGIAGCIALGLLFMRILGGKYAMLASLRGTPLYEGVLLADTAFLLAIPMLAVAALATLHADALFPDGTDYRVCLVLPVRRDVIFRAKLAALALFVGAVATVVHLALLPLLLLMWGGGGFVDALVRRLPALLVAGGCASIAAFTATIAMHGMALVLLPSRLRGVGTTVLRSSILALLVVCVPLAPRLSSLVEALARREGWVSGLPPVWFVGIEQQLLAHPDPFFSELALRGAAAIVLGLASAAGVYSVLYRRFDAPAAVTLPGRGWQAWHRRWTRIRPSGGACGGVYPFAVATLWRSPLHHGVFLSVAACGVGLVAQGGLGSPDALLAMPFVLVLLSCSALKSALSLPHQWRANWVFRQAERADSRPTQLRSVGTLYWRFGICLPVLASASVQLWMGAPQLLAAVPVILVCGWVLVELLLRDWRRIPFTCTYLPGRRTLAHTALILLNTFVLFTIGGVILARAAISRPRGAVVILVLLGGAAAAMRASRRALWRTTPLEFDATPDDRPQALGVSL